MSGSMLGRLWVLMATAFVDMIGYALILPLLPLYADRFGASAMTVGLLMASFALAQLVTAPLWGRLSDRIGRRPVIIGSQLLSGVAFAVFGFADAVWLLLISRLVQGAGSGSIAVVQAYVSDVATPETRAQALGWITAASSFGVMIGPAIGSLSFGFSPMAPGLIAAGFCMVNALFTFTWLPEPPSQKESDGTSERSLILPAIGAVFARPLAPVHRLIWIYTAGMMAFMAMNAVLALYLHAEFGITETSIGWFYVVVGMVSVIMRGLVLGISVRWFGEVRTLRLGALLLGFGMILMPFAQTVAVFLGVAVLVPIGTALLFPSTTSLISRHARKGAVGQTHGVQQAFGGGSRLLAPIWAGATFEFVGHAQPFWLAASLVLATAMFAWRLPPGPRRRRARANATTADPDSVAS